MRWWERIFPRRHLYNDLSEEMREHTEEKTEPLVRLQNLSRTECRLMHTPAARPDICRRSLTGLIWRRDEPESGEVAWNE
jgi:hypothetical protein